MDEQKMITVPENEWTELKSDVLELKTSLKEFKGDFKEFSDAFKGAKGVISTIKWSAAVGASITAIVGFIKHWR